MTEKDYSDEQYDREEIETDKLRNISDILKNDMLRYQRTLDAEEEFI